MAKEYDDHRDDRYDDHYGDYDDDYDDEYDDYDEDGGEDDRRPAVRTPKKSAAKKRAVKGGSHPAKRPAKRRASAKSAPSKRRDTSGGRARNSDKAGRKKRAIVIFAIEIVVLLGLLFGAYTLFVRMNVTSVGKTSLNVVTLDAESGKVNLKDNEIAINQSVADNREMKGYKNIALFGVDSRNKQLNKNTRSDTIIICSINQDSGEIRLVSVYRDTYLNLSNDTYNKCNSAYAKGGPAQAISMLNMNLDMDISDFVTVGFTGLTDVIDALGGVEIDVESSVIDHLNNYQISMVGKKSGTNAAGEDSFVATAGKDYIPVTQSGLQTLNGLQATAYCRIRYVGDDFARTQRQRRVLTAALAKAKTAKLSTLESIAGSLFEETYTSLDLQDIVGLLGNIASYHVVGDEGFPVEQYRTTGSMGSKYGSCVLPMDLKANVEWLHGFLFGDTGYQVTADVQRYSEKIAADVAQNLRH